MKPFTCDLSAFQSRRAWGLQWIAAMLAAPAHASSTLTLFTGDLPPFSIDGNPSQPGVLVELTLELLKRADLKAEVEFMPWARAIQEAKRQPRSLVLPLTRTPAREAQFQWLLKLSLQHFAFLNLKPAPRIKSLEQAKALKLGVLRGSPHTLRLTELGFDSKRVVQASSNDELQRMLKLGMVEAIYGSDLINLYNARHTDEHRQALQVGVTVESGEIWLAASSGIESKELLRLQQAAAEMEKEKFAEQLFRRYGLEPPKPRQLN